VNEQTFSGGFGTAFGAGRVITDVTVLHSTRNANVGVRERAWTLSIGLGIRP
jgi:hypothetical protein